MTYKTPFFLQDEATYTLIKNTFEKYIKAFFRHRRDTGLEIFARQNIIKAILPDGAMYLMLDIQATGVSGIDFANYLLKTHQIATMAGKNFYQASAGHIRIAMTVQNDIYEHASRIIYDLSTTLACNKN